jgi:hypothetical protein
LLLLQQQWAIAMRRLAPLKVMAAVTARTGNCVASKTVRACDQLAISLRSLTTLGESQKSESASGEADWGR